MSTMQIDGCPKQQRLWSATSTVACIAMCLAGSAVNALQPLEDFARMPQIRDVTISPDGHYVAFISAVDDVSVLMTFDRHAGNEFRRVATAEPGKFDFSWCKWASTRRLLCAVTGNIRGKKYAQPPFTRLIAVDADGKDLKTLELSAGKANLFVARTSMANLNMNQGSLHENKDFKRADIPRQGPPALYTPERQDEVIDVTPGADDTVLIQLDDDGDSYRSIFNLNIYSGTRSLRLRDHPPISHFVTDGKGNPRLGWGSTDQLNTHYFARVEGDDEWRALAKVRAFTATTTLLPIGAAHARNSAYALGDYEGRNALWELDLSDERNPQILFTHALVDVGEPILTPDRRLLGVRYDLDRPFAHYTDESTRSMMDRINGQLASRFSVLEDSTFDEKAFLIHSYSDVDQGTYYVFDAGQDKLQKLGTAYPELRQESLGTLRAISYRAADGTEIPGYLTVPSNLRAENLPLIVMPHDGPVARDTWQFSFLRTFLASRGYAVLQMNYRGSSGYGHKWLLDAHQDWGGLSYSDIADATRWAIAQGIADPKRVCIAGWGFGGYAALLGAVRHPDLYGCSISIAGISDLALQREHASIFDTAIAAYRREQIGSDAAKLERDSPLRQAGAVRIPVLLVHGDKDWQVQIDHSTRMEAALKRAAKPHKAVYLKSGDHALARKSDRVTLLREVETFLRRNIGAGARTGEPRS